MKSYSEPHDLVVAMNGALQKYLAEFADIPEALRDVRTSAGEKTPSEHLAYQLGWVNLLLHWEAEEQAGRTVQTPAPGYKWNNLGGLYRSFYEIYGRYSLAEQQEMLREKVALLSVWLEGLSQEAFLLPEQRRWATTAAKWPLWKWVHVNTVAPFTNFRTQIRRWKRMVL